MPGRRRRRVAGIASVAVIAAGVAAGVYFGPSLLDRYGDRYFSESLCTVTVGDESRTLTGEQAENAAVIGAFAVRRDLPPQSATIALAAAIQESGLRNVTYGDRDSLGLFQQRPSQGWGTAEQVSDPKYATRAFYEALVDVDGWETMDVTVAAQTVQRSAFPDAYADHEHEAELWGAALTGGAGLDAVACHLPDAVASPDAVAEFELWVRQNFGRTVTATPATANGETAVIRLEHNDGGYRDALASWAVASATAHPIESVSWCGSAWTRDSGEWVTGADVTGADVTGANVTDETPSPRADCDSSGVEVVLALH